MFSFHKPKVYRSTQGCCICKAKSSSSRFTDSKKYETDFIECFQLTAPRKGEICNACVLLVKRFKRLPPGSERHWGHVVDARVGPGLKSMTKFKKRKEESMQQQQKQEQKVKKENSVADGETTQRIGSAQRFCKIFKKNKKKKTNGESSIGGGSHGSSDDVSSPSSPLSYGSDGEDSAVKARKRAAMGSFDNLKNFVTNEFTNGYRNDNIGRRSLLRKDYRPVKNRSVSTNGILRDIQEDELWTKTQMCCGPVYENKDLSAIIVDMSCLKVCRAHRNDQVCAKKSPVGFGAIAIKKHHLFSKARGNLMDFATVTSGLAQPIVMDVGKSSSLTCPTLAPSANALMKLKGEAGKVVKAKEYNFVKNIVKICNETKTPTNKTKTLEKVLSATENLGNKFSDNSSDSGYEELPNMLDSKNPLITPSVRNGVMQNGMIIGMNQITLPQTQPISSTTFKRSPGRIHTDRVETVIYARTGL
ncbi:uncharacterized protein LOC132263115 [Phlebotomus argentipes]|uniref:uncharacterized protein LOC132263115 n=1 Tax=Phlebotomus argentipes TaxID=94469 RepID=UPI0028935C95|nr:uncharacterized protein LOC132263115 [Phlebotomus argentipes]XP_059618683.1 uncharacterized protein LOC132263115 [Phlebotomus argentipes]XP_059618684.1 uncharacterized protein LOC132263115 [Phlebotomus argentipes]